MRYFGCCVVDCGEVEGCAAITVLYVDHPASVTAASWRVGGGSVGGREGGREGRREGGREGGREGVV